MKIKLILNPVAGRGRARKAIPIIKQIFRNRKVDFDMDVTQRSGQATYLSQQASRKNFRIIVAAGGDGTVNEVVNGMMWLGSILGVIPLGLGNDFAKAINISSKLEEACQVLCNGVVKEIDVGRLNNRYFVNGLGMGFDAQVARMSQRIKWFFLPNWIYLYAVLRVLLRYKASSVKINLNDIIIDKKVLLVAIGNGKSSGGGFLLNPQAELDDGLLDVCIIDDVARLKLLKNLPKALKGTHIRLPYVTTHKTKKLIIYSVSPLLAHVDGEILEDSQYQIEILPKSLRVITS